MAAIHLLGDIWSPTLMGWVADTFGQADSMATPFGQALAAIGAVPRAQPGRDPENLTAALLDRGPRPGDRGHRAALRRPAPAPRDGPDARQAQGGAEPAGSPASPQARRRRSPPETDAAPAAPEHDVN